MASHFYKQFTPVFTRKMLSMKGKMQNKNVILHLKIKKNLIFFNPFDFIFNLKNAEKFFLHTNSDNSMFSGHFCYLLQYLNNLRQKAKFTGNISF